MLNKKGYLLIESLLLLQCIIVVTSLLFTQAIQERILMNQKETAYDKERALQLKDAYKKVDLNVKIDGNNESQ